MGVSPSPLGPDPRRAAEIEIRHHIEERTERLVEEGWDPEEARAEAERRFGEVSRYRDEMAAIERSGRRRTTMGDAMESLVKDVRYALRGMVRRPVFAWTLIGTLALGIGAAGSIFSVVDAVMLRPLPYDRPEELVAVSLVLEERSTTLPFLLERQVDPWLEAQDFLHETAVTERMTLTRTDPREPELLAFQAVSHDLDDLLGMEPALGRVFGPGDARPGAERVVILSHAYWRRIGSPPDIVGEEIRLEEEPFTVVGVLPPDFRYPVDGEVEGWLPLATDRTVAGRAVDRLRIVGRLAPGVELEAAQARADILADALRESSPERLGWSVRLAPVDSWRGNAETERGLWLLSAAVGLMLLIALANSVNLLLVRTAGRRHELGIRSAVGASAGRIRRQMLVEGVVLGATGGLLAVAVAWALVAGLRAALPADVGWSSVFRIGLESRSLLFIFAVATLSGGLVGLLPAIRAARFGGPATRSVTGGVSGRRLLDFVVATEVALSVALLGGAGLFVHSFALLLKVDPGYEVESLVQVEMGLSERVYPSPAERRDFVDRVVAEIEGLPHVESVSPAVGLPPDGGGIAFGSGIQAEGREALEGMRGLPFAQVEPDFADVMGIAVAEGRFLRRGDDETNGVVIDRDLARDLFGSASPVGERYRMSEGGQWYTVVGVVEDLKFVGLDDRVSTWAALYALAPGVWPGSALSLAVRTRGEAADALLPVREAIRRVDPIQPVSELVTARTAMAETLATPRFLTLVLGALAAASTLLAAVGVYGVLSFAVTQRRREMGIRMALGAPRATIRLLVIRSGFGFALLGAVVGVGFALVLSDMAAGLLFGVEPGDPRSLGAGAGVMLVAAFVACWLPARRATRVDPVEVLGAE